MATPMTFQFLDVGMGDGTLVIMGTGKKTQLALIDYGVQPFAKFKVGAKEALTYLVDTIADISHNRRDLPAPTLDHLFLTHPDQDHYNYIAKLIGADYGEHYPDKKLKIGRVTYGGVASDYKKLMTYLKSVSKVDTLGHSFRSPIESGVVKPFVTFVDGTVKVYLLSSNYPMKSSDDPNTQSLCLMFYNDSSKMIFMGDAEKPVEAGIIKYFSTAPADFLSCWGLKLGHHGSLNATGEDWLNAVKPDAVFASGDFVWAHPYCPTIQRAIDSKHVKEGPRDIRYCCGVSGGEYDNKIGRYQVFLNLWYVVKEPKGKDMESSNPDSLVVVTAPQGLTYGVQWAVEFRANRDIFTYPSETWSPTAKG